MKNTLALLTVVLFAALQSCAGESVDESTLAPNTYKLAITGMT